MCLTALIQPLEFDEMAIRCSWCLRQVGTVITMPYLTTGSCPKYIVRNTAQVRYPGGKLQTRIEAAPSRERMQFSMLTPTGLQFR